VARVGIVGFPNVGKSTLFNALTGLDSPTAPHPLTTAEPVVGVARVPDERLERAGELEGSAKVTHATLDLLDLPPLGAGGGGAAGRHMGRLREMDAIALVLRAFASDAVPADDSGTDPVDQAERLLLELTLADAEVFERRRERAEKEAMADQAKRPFARAVAAAAAHLSEGIPMRSRTWSEAERDAFRDMAPLTLKPAVWVVNTDEDGADPDALRSAVTDVVPEGDTVVVASARLEEEAARLDPADRAELYEGLGLGSGALARMVGATYDALGLISFYTVGPKESRAWTVRRGAPVKEAAGRIHSDLERGFIRAEVAPIDAVIEAGGWDAAKAAGAMRLEGKDYAVVEGDAIVVRFSV
jgi:hypothetical protein